MFAAGLKNAVNQTLGNIGSSDTNQLTLSLMTSDYTANIATDEWWSDISANQVTTDDYTPGGETIDKVSLVTSSNATILVSTTDVIFCTSGSIKAYGGVARATSYLVSYIDFDGEQESVDGSFRVNWNSSGLIRFSVTTS
jgi:hypothetical protein